MPDQNASLWPLGRGMVAFLALLLVGCGDSGQLENPAAKGSRPRNRAADQAQVAVVGTQHLLTDMQSGYTPGDLRALLTKLAPDILAVEAPANVPDPWQFAPLDVTLVVKPWAEKHHVPLIPIGWFESDYESQFDRMLRSIDQQDKMADYEELERTLQYQTSKRLMTCRFLNSEMYQHLWRAYHYGLHKLYGQDTPWEAWNAKIAQNVLDVCLQHPGDRVVVVIGAPHAYYLLAALRRSGDVRVISTEQQFPLSPEEVAAATTPVDYLRALRMLDFDTLPANELPRLSNFLDKIEGVPELSGDYHLCKGKWLLHRGQFAAARQQFELVSKLDERAVSALDGRSPLREAGLVYGAIAKQRSGDTAGAKAELQAVLDTPSITDATKQWAGRVLADLKK